MPRQRRTHRARVDLASLVERAQQQSNYSGHPSRVQSRLIRAHAHIFSNSSRSRGVRSGHTSRNAGIGVGTHAVWKTLVQPISILQWLPLRRSMRMHRSSRSRSRRRQRNNSGDNKSSYNTPKLGRQSRVPAAEVEMTCCANESPTAEVQLASNTEVNCQQDGVDGQTFRPSHSTVILHQNPLFDAEGNTRSGLIDRSTQKAKIDKVKSKWNVRCGKKPTQQCLSAAERQDAVKNKKSGVEKKVPAKKGSGTEDSSAASMNSPSTASSAKSKTGTEESNSYEEDMDLATQAAGGVKLEERVRLDTAAALSNANTTNMPVCMAQRSVLNERTALIDLTRETPPPLQPEDESASRISGRNDRVAVQFDDVTVMPENIETMFAK